MKLGFVAAIPALILIDQLSKWWVIERYFRLNDFAADGASVDFIPWLITTGQQQLPPLRHEITGFFDLVMAWNTGVSFSMFASDNAVMPLVLTGVALILSLGFMAWLFTTRAIMTALPLVLIIAGALSNVWDRMRFGAVADFLYFHVGEVGWPAFNIADSCIVLGVALLAWDSLFLEPKRRKGDAP
jgi:signal peptidase II